MASTAISIVVSPNSAASPRSWILMSEFAKQVAKQLDHRQRRRRVMFLGAFGTLVALAVFYLRCGSGFGIGGAGTGSGSGIASPAPPSLKRCAIKVTAQGIFVDGKKLARDAAVDACKKTTGADVIVTGDARQGDWDDLRAALDA